MRAVRYRISLVLRARWRSTVVLSLIVAAVTAGVLAFAAGAERTSSAPDRFGAASGAAFDGEVQQERGRPRTSEVAALPGALSVEATTFVFGGLVKPGDPSPIEVLVFSGRSGAIGLRVVAGREADPASTREFVVTRGFTEATGAAIGDRFDLSTLTQAQADAGGFGAFAEGPGGPSLDAVLVGVVDGPDALNNAESLALFPASLLDDPDVGVASTIMGVRLRPGTDLPSFRAQLDSLPGREAFSLGPFELVDSDVKTAIEVQARALWLLAAVGAAAAVVVLGQLITRSVRFSDDEVARLKAIGFSGRQLLADAVGRATLPILVGTALGAAAAAYLSPFFPTGFVRRIEPHPGLRVAPTVLASCAAILLVALLAWTVLALILARPARGGQRPSALVESVASRCVTPAMATGFRFAFTRSQRDRGSVRTAVAGMLIVSAILVGAVVFGSSLGRLVTDGNRFGNNFDLVYGTGGDVVPDEIRAGLENDADVAALMLYGTIQARVDSATIGVAGMNPVKGDLAPKILRGRLPAAADEIALGRLAAQVLGTEVGRDLTVEGAGQVQRFRVTGLAVVPGINGLDGIGKDAVATMAGLERLDPAVKPSVAAIALREGAPASTAERLGLGQNSRPTVILNLGRIRSTPYLLALLVGSSAALGVVHVMVTSIHNRRRAVAVLRALGADRRLITRTVHWQATMFSLIPLALGVPLGLIAGRLVFVLFADSIGAVPQASIPFTTVAATLAASVMLANAAAAIPAHRARRLEPSRLLTNE